MEYPKSIVKSANERLRKLERGYTAKIPKELGGGSFKISSDTSAEYRVVEQYAIQQFTSGQVVAPIYKVASDGFGIRFISKTEFEKLDANEQRYFINIVNQFMESQTSTVTGIVESYKNAYEGIMRTYGDKYPNLTMEEYLHLFKAYADNLETKDTHRGYDYLMQMFDWLDIPALLDANALEETMANIRSGNWHLIDKRFHLQN